VGFQGVPWASTYAATKAFIQSFAEGLYWEYKKSGVDVISVAPGPVQSGLWESVMKHWNTFMMILFPFSDWEFL